MNCPDARQNSSIGICAIVAVLQYKRSDLEGDFPSINEMHSELSRLKALIFVHY